MEKVEIREFEEKKDEYQSLTMDEIKQLKMPVVPKRKTKKKKVYSTGSNSYTIGDQLRAQGIDLTKWPN